MRSGSLSTFKLQKGGRKVVHVSTDYPGWMNWNHFGGVITCEILSPNKPRAEWKLFHAFLGRLADRFAADIHSVHVQFPHAEGKVRAVGAKSRRQ
jgi:hypothetical protein